MRAARAADTPSVPPVPPTSRKSTVTGDVRTHANFHSKILNNDHNLYVYLPPGYDKNPDQRYAVLYMQDGQNLFDAALNPAGEWRADETAQWLIPRHKIEPLIIVGISNDAQRRLDEYTLSRDERMKAGGKGEDYIKFVCEEVKPFIDKTYRTKTDRDHTGVGGSSLGATIGIEMCREHPEMFGRCVAMSPALWWNNWDLPKRIQNDLAWTHGLPDLDRCRHRGSASAAIECVRCDGWQICAASGRRGDERRHGSAIYGRSRRRPIPKVPGRHGSTRC